MLRRLCVSVALKDPSGQTSYCRNSACELGAMTGEEPVNVVIEELQRTAMEREIFMELMGNVALLTTAPVVMQEMSISVEVAPGVHLKFDLVFTIHCLMVEANEKE